MGNLCLVNNAALLDLLWCATPCFHTRCNSKKITNGKHPRPKQGHTKLWIWWSSVMSSVSREKDKRWCMDTFLFWRWEKQEDVWKKEQPTVRFLCFQDREWIVVAARKSGKLRWNCHNMMIFPDYSKLVTDKHFTFTPCKRKKDQVLAVITGSAGSDDGGEQTGVYWSGKKVMDYPSNHTHISEGSLYNIRHTKRKPHLPNS